MAQVSAAFQTDKPLASYGHLARLVEGYGFSGVSLYNDLFYQPCWPGLQEMARATERIRIGPAAVNPFTTHPVVIAGEISLLDEASGGRAYLGLARGAWLDHLGLHPEEPVAALQEAFGVVRHLLLGNEAAFRGKVFHLAVTDRLKWPVYRSEIPFMLGSWGKRTIQACVEYVQEVKLGGTANPDLLPRYLKLLKEVAGAAHNEIDLVVGAVTVVDEDGDAARAYAKQEVGLYLPVVAKLDPTLQIEDEIIERIEEANRVQIPDQFVSLISDELLARFAFAGTANEITIQALQLIEVGANRIEFGTPHGLEEQRGLELLGREVLPALRTHGILDD